MKKTTDILALRQPKSVDDPLTEIARDGARRMLAAALRAEADTFVEQHAEEMLPDGRQRVARHGYGPERSIQTGIGALDLLRPKVRDRATDVPPDQKIRFTSAILPKWAWRPRSLFALPPVLYLRGTSTGDFREAVTAILGAEAPNLSPSMISRLTGKWQQEHDRWAAPPADTSMSRRMACTCRPEWSRMPNACWSFLVPRQKGRRNCSASWSVRVRARRAVVSGWLTSRRAAEVAVGDEATGFWKALDEVFPGARHQRYWVHKVANVLNKFPKSMQPTVKADLHEIWRAETHAAAETVMDTFAENYSAKYEQVRTSDDLPDQEPRALDRPNYGLVADLFQSVPELTEKLG